MRLKKSRKKIYAIVKKAVDNTNSDMKAYFAKQQLADGRNALEAFEQDNALRIRRRLEQTASDHFENGTDRSKENIEGMGKG